MTTREVIYKDKGEIAISKKWTTDELEILKERYTEFGAGKLAEELVRSKSAIEIKANRMGLVRPHHIFDIFYFDNIDSADKAYWLGFIAADGYVTHSVEGRNWELGLELAVKDRGHLQKFTMALNSDAEVTMRAKQGFKKRGYNTASETALVRIYSKHMVEKLIEYGIIPNKTYEADDFYIPDDYLWNYIRGYFDGDGSIFYRSCVSSNGTIHKYINLNIVGYSKVFLSRLMDIFLSYGIGSTITSDKLTWCLNIRTQSSVEKFFSNIYYSSEVAMLDRKYITYLESKRLNCPYKQ